MVSIRGCVLSGMSAMTFRQRLLWLAVFWMFWTPFSLAHAQSSSLLAGVTCPAGWSFSGNTYTCEWGKVVFPDGYTLNNSAAITIHAKAGMEGTNIILGSIGHPVTLRANGGSTINFVGGTVYGDLNTAGPVNLTSVRVSGSIISTNASITLDSGEVGGDVRSVGGTITTAAGTIIRGAVTANGNINLSGGSVSGRVTSSSNRITTTNTDLLGGLVAQSGMDITGGTISGDIIMTAFNGLTLNGVTMTGGNIETPDRVTIIDSVLGGLANPSVDITVDGSAYITLQNSTVYGDLYYPQYARPNITGDESSAVIGICYRNRNPDDIPPSVCKGKGWGQVQIAYYQISHQTPALTCEAEPVTVTAFDANHQVMAPAAGTMVTFSMSPANGSWVGGNSWVFSGSESSVTRHLRNTTAGNLSLSVTDGNVSGSSTIEFVAAALKFYGIQHMVAGVAHNAALRAVQTNTDTGACEARLQNTNRPVQLAYECRNPQTCVSGQVLSVAGSTVASNDAGASLAYSPVSLSFDANGVAELPLNYTDVGQLRLHAQLPLPEADNDPAIVLSGSSSEFVVKPYQVIVSEVENNPKTEESGAGFVAAGEAFKVTLEVQNAQGNVTPNFGNEASPEQVSVDVAQLVYPVAGDKGGLSGNENFVAVAGSAGRFSSSDLRWDNVGTITLSAGILDGDYLGAGDVANKPESEPVGRFYPYEFHLLSSELNNSCGNFSHMTEGDAVGQPALPLSYRLEARGFNTGALSNYDEGLGYPVADRIFVAENAGQSTGDDLNSRLIASAGSWSQGELNVVNGGLQLQRDPTKVDGPFHQFQLGVQVEDVDGARLSDSYLNMNCVAANNCNAASLGALVDIRYGRIMLKGGHGPETVNLPAILATEYWDGSRWIKNSDDNCSVVLAHAIYQNDESLLDRKMVAVGNGVSEGDFVINGSGQVVFASGQALNYFQAPGYGNTGSFTVKVDLTNYPWLQFDWNSDGSLDDQLNADISFGSYRGHDRIIYWREVFE